MTEISDKLKEQFYAGRRSSEVPLCVNDSVRIVHGPLSGTAAAVISIESVGVDPEFLVELGGSGGDVVLPLSALALDRSE